MDKHTSNNEAPQADFIAQSKNPALSISFITGCVLITAAAIAGVILDFTLPSIIASAIATIIVAPLWMIIIDTAMAGKSRKTTLFALSMLSVAAKLCVGLLNLIFFIFIILAHSLLSGTAIDNLLGGTTALLCIILLCVFCMAMGKFFLSPLLAALKNIKTRINTNDYVPLVGLNRFLVTGCILIGLSVVIALFGVGPYVFQHPRAFFEVFSRFECCCYRFEYAQAGNPNIWPDMTWLNWGTLLAIVNAAGMLLCLYNLRKIK